MAFIYCSVYSEILFYIFMREYVVRIMKMHKENITAFFFFFAVSLVITWPLVLHLQGFLLPQKYASIGDIPNSDTIEHIQRLEFARENFLRAGNFFIIDFTDVAQTYLMFGIATHFFGITATVAHNLYFLLSVFLSGYCMYFFCREITKNEAASLWGGFFYMSSPYIFYEYVYGHSNIWQIQWIPLIFFFLEKYLKSPRYIFSFFLGIALVLQLISSTQYAIYMSFAIFLYIVLRLIFDYHSLSLKNIWKKIILFLLIFFVSSGNYLIKKITLNPPVILDSANFRWSVNTLFELINPKSHVSFNMILFFPIIFGMRRVFRENLKDNLGFLRIFFIKSLLFIALMFGPVSVLYPYAWLLKLWPFFQYVRTPYRFFPFALMSAIVISSFFFTQTYPLLRKKRLVFLVVTIVALFLNSPWFLGRHMFYI